MSKSQHNGQAQSFGRVAALYDQVRPDYPAAAVEWALAPLGTGCWRLADIGAGTGIMTRRLMALGHRVVAIEPDRRMRARLEATSPGAELLDGSAEALPLPDSCVDAAVAAQSYHWFQPAQAHQQLARVIRPGGVFAAIWNVRDPSVAWSRAYSAIVAEDRGADSSPERSVESLGAEFSAATREWFAHRVRTTPQRLLALARSRSYVITASPERAAAIEAELRQLLATHPDLRGRAEFDLPYVTEVVRAVRR